MTEKKMTRQQEIDFYADPDNQTPQGPARRRKQPLSTVVPVRFTEGQIEQVRTAADSDHRSVSAWIRLAVERELQRTEPA